MAAGAAAVSRRGFLGLGSNLGDPRANLEAAVAGLRRGGIDVVASSSVYDTEPVGLVLDQPGFLNAVLEVAVDPALEPLALLDLVKGLEIELGREPGGERHGPRVIDIDLLWLEDVELAEERLTLPHPGLTQRRFVLVPLLELDPDLELPDGERLAGVLVGLGGQRVALAGPPLL